MKRFDYEFKIRKVQNGYIVEQVGGTWSGEEHIFKTLKEAVSWLSQMFEEEV